MLATLAFAAIALQTPFDQLLNSPDLRGAVVSAIVTKADGQVLFERDSDRRVMPASNQKLLTTAYALARLGPNFVPKTRFWKEPDRIVVDAPGDPGMTFQDLLAARKALGVSQLTPVFAREAYRPMFGPNWELGDLPEDYAAAVTALTVDKGTFKIWASKRAVEPLPDFADVRLRTFPGEKLTTRYDPFTKVATVIGPLPEERTEIATYALPEPDRAAARIFGGPLFFTEALPDRTPDYVHQGSPLKDLVAECLTISDNLYAENLLLMAALRGKSPMENPYSLAQKQLKRFLTDEVGCDPNDVRPDDGSGMSRHNNVTARSVAKLLTWAQSQSWFEEWRAGLVVGSKGTLRTRLAGSSFQGKTGTLDMTVALSGYVTNKAGERLIVSVIFNHYACTTAKAREIADNFILTAEGSSISGTNYASVK